MKIINTCEFKVKPSKRLKTTRTVEINLTGKLQPSILFLPRTQSRNKKSSNMSDRLETLKSILKTGKVPQPTGDALMCKCGLHEAVLSFYNKDYIKCPVCGNHKFIRMSGTSTKYTAISF